MGGMGGMGGMPGMGGRSRGGMGGMFGGMGGGPGFSSFFAGPGFGEDDMMSDQGTRGRGPKQQEVELPVPLEQLFTGITKVSVCSVCVSCQREIYGRGLIRFNSDSAQKDQ